MGDVIFKPSAAFRKKAGAVPKPRRKRQREIESGDLDPRRKIADRTFEIAQVYVCAETTIERRIRIRVKKGDPSDNVFDVAEGWPCYFGMVSEQLVGRDKWSPYTWGHVPVQECGWVREIVDDTPPAKLKKDETKDE